MTNTIKLAIFTLILTLSANVAFAQTTAQDHYKVGLQEYQQKNFQAAIASFDRCLAVSPNATICKNARGLAYIQTKDFDKAVLDFTALLGLSSLNSQTKVQVLNGRVQAYCLSGNVAEATADESRIKSLGGNVTKTCVQFLAENPNLRPDSSGTVESFVKSGDKALIDRKFKDALSNYKKALDLNKTGSKKSSNIINSEFYVNLAIANRYNSNHDQAYLDLKKALELDPQNYKALAKRGEYYSLDKSKNPNNLKLAEADLTKAIDVNPLGEEAYGKTPLK